MATKDELGKGIATGDEAVKVDRDLAQSADYRASETQRANEVISAREAQGLDTTTQKAYLAKIASLNSGGNIQSAIESSMKTSGYSPEAAASGSRTAASKSGYADLSYDRGVMEEVPLEETPAEASTLSQMYQQLAELIAGNKGEQTEAARQASEAALKAQIAGIEGSYNQAVSEEEKAKQTATQQYEDQLESIDENRYKAQEYSKVTGEARGIGSSAQFDALSRGTISAAGKAKVSAAENRNTALNNISERITQLGLQKGLDVAGAEAASAYSLATQTGQIAQSASEQQAAALQQQIGQAYGTSERIASQDYSTGERVASQDYNTSERVASQSYNTLEREAQQDFEVDMFGKETTFQKEMTQIQYQNNVKLMNEEYNLQDAAESAQYAKDLQRQLNNFTKGTAEYNAAQGMLDMELEQMRAKAELDLEFNNAYADAQIERQKDMYEWEYDQQTDSQLSVFTEGTPEYNIALGVREREKEYALDDIAFEIQADTFAEYLVSQPLIEDYEPTDLEQITDIAVTPLQWLGTALTFGVASNEDMKNFFRSNVTIPGTDVKIGDIKSGYTPEERQEIVEYSALDKMLKDGSASQQYYDYWKKQLDVKYDN